jgi:hypothetical protein
MIGAVRKTVWLFAGLCIALAAPAAAADDPLVKAAADGNVATVTRLLAAGSSADSHNDDGLTALNWAAYKGRTTIVRLLLAKHAAVDSHANAAGWTPLMNAAHGGYNEVVTLLLTAGADVNAKSTDGMTPLWYAAAGDKPKTIALLRAHGGTGDLAPVTAPQRLCDAVKATLGKNEKGLVWSAYNDKSHHFGCNATKHAFPGGEGEIIMFNYQADGDETGARSFNVVAHVYASALPKDVVNETLQPLLRDLFAKLGRGAVPADLAQAMTAFSDIETDTALGHVTGHFKLGDDASLPNNGAEYGLTVALK